MFGVHVETIDYNLPVDAITRKPLFAFSVNRSIRENYKGPLLKTTSGVDITSENIASHVGQQINRIYDQKAKHGYVDKTCNSDTGPTLGVDEDGSYYLQFVNDTSFLVDIHGEFSDAGFMIVCSSEGFGQHKTFRTFGQTHEMSFVLGSAYMRFHSYEIPEPLSDKVFGSIDYPNQSKNGYIMGIEGGRSYLRGVRGEHGTGFSSNYNYNFFELGGFGGRIYEFVACDFSIPKASIPEIFDDWGSFYSLT